MKILWVPHTGWHIPQRAHLFCRVLAQRHQVHVTDWVADFASLRDYISLRYVRNFTYRRYVDGSITVHGVPRISPALFSHALRRLNEVIFSWFVRRIIEEFRIDVVVGTFVVPPPRAPRVVFDLFDDNAAYWRAYGRVKLYADEIAQTESAYLRKADAVVAASLPLAEKARALGAQGPVYHIPNGIDLKQYEMADGSAFRAELGVTGLLVGLVGNNDKESELGKVIDAAKILEDEAVTFLVAGRGTALSTAQGRVRREGISNVIFAGYVAPEKAADVVSALDVGLCPYQKTPGAEASSPMRLLMYAAAGVPTVCTDLESVRRMGLPNVILVNDDGNSLAAGIRQALRLPRGRPRQMADYDLRDLADMYQRVLMGDA